MSNTLITEGFTLVEKVRDFRILAELCNDPRVLAHIGVSNAEQLCEARIESLGDAFAFQLYQWYIDNGRSICGQVGSKNLTG